MAFRKILVANRGEIAVRVMRTCARLGVSTVAVYSDADARAPHVLAADHAVALGGSAPGDSYLNVAKIVEACRSSGADALHPGYGFLSEQPALARACADAGVTFIGPPPEALELLGNKIASRALMEKSDVPVMPGSEAQSWVEASLSRAAERIGYPVLLKAAAGGGGKGMRVVREPASLWDDYQSATREAESAFGDGSVFVEKYLERPRHVEIQILADGHGNCVYLGERECSIQRRHQKIIEESPSVAVDKTLRARMGQAAVAAARAAGYVNAGTVEFLLDQNGEFYFLEVNARLQVEHPVTEMVTGIDIVAEQIRIAAGEQLGRTQDEIVRRGHAIECRVYAEDAENDFLPSPGRLLLVREPAGPGVRVDSGVCTDFEVPLDYDPILAKLVCFGETRAEARAHTFAALSDFVVLGVKTPIAMMRDVLEHPAFVRGDLHTGFLPEHFAGWSPDRSTLPAAVAAAVAAPPAAAHTTSSAPATPWQTLGAWEVGS